MLNTKYKTPIKDFQLFLWDATQRKTKSFKHILKGK